MQLKPTLGSLMYFCLRNLKTNKMSKEHLLSDRVNAMEESATIRMSQKARELKNKGVAVINLSLGEPDFDTPEFIKEAAKKALDQGFTKYSPVPGYEDLRQAICDKLKQENHLRYTPNQIVVSNGAKQCIANICLAMLNEGDEAIILAPYWVSYNDIVKFVGGVPIIVSAGIEQDFKVKPAQIKAAITPKTKLIIFSSPCNPTGSVYSKSELEDIADVLAEHQDIIVVSDEIYEYIQFGGDHFSFANLPGMYDRTITVNGFSKGYSMTGWRLGYLAAPAWIAAACAKIQGQFTSGASSFGQKAAIAALQAGLDKMVFMTAAFKKRRDLVIEGLDKIEGIKTNHPTGAFYVFPDISYFFGRSYKHHHIKDSNDFAEFILEEAHVALVAGEAFGANECVRISYAASDEEIKEAIKRIGEAVAHLK